MLKLLKAITEFGAELSGLNAAIRRVREQFEAIGDHMDSLGSNEPELIEAVAETVAKPKALAKPKVGRGRPKKV